MGTIVVTGSQHKCCFNVDRVVMTGRHYGNDNDDWQSAEKVCPAPRQRAFTLRFLVFREGSKIAAGKYLRRFPAIQHAVAVTIIVLTGSHRGLLAHVRIKVLRTGDWNLAAVASVHAFCYQINFRTVSEISWTTYSQRWETKDLGMERSQRYI